MHTHTHKYAFQEKKNNNRTFSHSQLVLMYPHQQCLCSQRNHNMQTAHSMLRALTSVSYQVNYVISQFYVVCVLPQTLTHYLGQIKIEATINEN